MTRRVAVVIYPGFQLLDAAGPIAVFEIAARLQPGAYELHLLASEAGQVRSSAGLLVVAEALSDAPWDTVLTVGGSGVPALEETVEIAAWLARVAPSARRVGSVCSGAYLLAEAGLLDGRRATTHWRCADDFAQRYPAVRLDSDRIFIRDGKVWTSAGVTAGIDLALALIEEDLGPEVSRRTAQQMVIHHRRPGGQSQFSSLLEGLDGRFADLMAWARERLTEPLSVQTLAAQAAMSARHFARAFRSETGLTPAKAVERLRVEAARVRLETTAEPIERVAEAVGFGDQERMRRAFLRAFGQPPQALRRAARR